jgi:hypothetical protein
LIKPGETEEFAVTLSCHKLRGTFTRNIVVTTNDPSHPKETLVCKGQVLEPFNITPKLVNFGLVSPAGPARQKTLSITRGDGDALKLKLLPIKAEAVAASLNEVEPGERYELVVSLNPPLAAQRIRASLQLETGVPQSPTATIPVYATIARRVGAEQHPKPPPSRSKGVTPR